MFWTSHLCITAAATIKRSRLVGQTSLISWPIWEPLFAILDMGSLEHQFLKNTISSYSAN
jgi:hypothetical protein